MPPTSIALIGVGLTFLVALTGWLSSYFGVKFGLGETQRLVKALHGRFDRLAAEVAQVTIGLAETQRDVAWLQRMTDIPATPNPRMRESQRIRLRAAAEAATEEAAAAGQPPMFRPGSE
jgi:hypothetical protein